MHMKTNSLLLILIFLLSGICGKNAYSQEKNAAKDDKQAEAAAANQKSGSTPAQVKYTYDASGNRVSREKVINMRSMLKSSVGGDNENSETDVPAAEIPIYEDVLSDMKITIYPNPTKGLLRVDITGGEITKDARIYLYNMQGMLIRQMTGISATNNLDISSQPAGIYILHIMTDKKNVTTWKIIKE